MIGLTVPVPTTATSAAELPLADAVELASAWATALAGRLGIRVLVIKGDVLARHGLRDARVSADVDLLVDPRAYAKYCAALVEAGWSERAVPFINAQNAHSVTYLHEGWPCDIDVHHEYPGFLEDDSTVFEELWRRHVVQQFAHALAPAPDRLASLLVMALHALRDGAVMDRHRAELARVRATQLSDGDRRELASLAVATGCAGPLREILAGFGIELTVDDSPQLREWYARVSARSQGAYSWLLLWNAASRRQKPAIAFRALWPTRGDILAARPNTTDHPVAIAAARVTRLARGLRGLPVGIRAIRSSHVDPPVTRR